MDTFITTLHIILPTFLLIALGYIVRLSGTVNDEGCEQMNRVTFRIFYPAMVFYNIYTSDTDMLSNLGIISFASVSMTALFFLLMLGIPLLEKDNVRRGVLVQGIYRSSFVALGMGIVSSVYPSQTGVTAMLSAVAAPMFNVFAVIALETYSDKKISIQRIVINIVTNPLIIGSVLALFMQSMELRLPAIAETVVCDLSKVATPFALMVSGAAFRFSSVGDRKRPLIMACLGKLVLVPMVFVTLAVVAGFRGVELLTLLVFFGSPNAVSSHIMAANSGADDQLAGQIVVFTTCFSAFTLFGFIYVLLSFGFI
ncbi:MAG: AEC family transporter [Angelakisella sp.]